MTDVSDPGSVQRLAAISFGDDLRAVEFMTAITRLARDGKLALHDGGLRREERRGSHVRPGDEGPAAGPDGDRCRALERAVRAAARRSGRDARRRAASAPAPAPSTAKVVDVGVTDDFVAQLREMVQPGTTTVAVLADHVDADAVLAELQRFEGARYVAGNLPLTAIQAVRDALGDPAATSGATFDPPVADESAPG